MYKVFIKNRPVVFQQGPEKSQLIVGKDIIGEDFNIATVEGLSDNEKEVTVSGDVLANMKRLFESFSKVTAAGGVVINKGKILFIERNGYWDLPKGKLEHESVRECALREVEEECGIGNLQIIRELPSTFHTYEYNNESVLKRSYWFEMSGDASGGKPQTEEGITQICRMTIDEFDAVNRSTYASINELLNIYRR